MSKQFAIIAGAVVVAGLAGTYLATSGLLRSDPTFAQCRGGQVAGGDIGGPFTLLNDQGQEVTEADVITGPSIVYFGYTFCPDVCPMDMARNAEATAILEESGIMATPVFISIDPDRDTPEVVGLYADNFHERAVGLTGSAEQVAGASRAYRTYYAKQEGDPEYYLVDHSTFTYFVTPESGFLDFFRRETTPEQIAEAVSCFVNAGAS